MDWIYEIPFWAILIFALSLAFNIVLLCLYLSTRGMRNSAVEFCVQLMEQVNTFKTIASNCEEIVHLEHKRVVSILDRSLPKEKKEEIMAEDDTGD